MMASFLTLMVGKVVFVSASLRSFPYLHPLAHGIRLMLNYFINRCLFGVSNSNNFIMAAAATVSSASYRHPESGEMEMRGVTKHFFFKYGGLFRVLCGECILYLLYGCIGVLVRGGPLLRLCKEMDICTFVVDLNIAEQGNNQTTFKSFYIHAFKTFGEKF